MQRVLLLTLALLLTPLSWAEEEMTIYSELTFLSSAPGAEAALEAALLEGRGRLRPTPASSLPGRSTACSTTMAITRT
ncbi:MAG: hypothetical protein O2811_07540 [Proteobacteria bacterium]|nr:hypothetical protein [Pseudomonadota bacterium]